MPNIRQRGVLTPFSLFRAKALKPILPSGRYFFVSNFKKSGAFFTPLSPFF